MGEDDDDDDFIEPAANIESSSDHPRVAKEPDYGNTPPLHSLPPQLFDGPEALAKAIDSMDREHMEDLIRQAQAAVKDLENIVLVLTGAAILLSRMERLNSARLIT